MNLCLKAELVHLYLKISDFFYPTTINLFYNVAITLSKMYSLPLRFMKFFSISTFLLAQSFLVLTDANRTKS